MIVGNIATGHPTVTRTHFDGTRDIQKLDSVRKKGLCKFRDLPIWFSCQRVNVLDELLVFGIFATLVETYLFADAAMLFGHSGRWS